jgi:hypothetical protein
MQPPVAVQRSQLVMEEQGGANAASSAQQVPALTPCQADAGCPSVLSLEVSAFSI